MPDRSASSGEGAAVRPNGGAARANGAPAKGRGPDWFGRAYHFFSRRIWELDLGQLSGLRAWLLRWARVLFLAGRGFVQDRCAVRASALTYISILSLVPLLAFLFSVAKGFGFYQDLLEGQIRPFLNDVFGAAPGSGAGPVVGGESPGALGLRDAVDQVLRTVESTNFRALGASGLIFLLYTVVRLLGTIEDVFNEIWGVTRSRTLVRRIADYLAMAVVTPFLLFAGAGLSATAGESGVVHWIEDELGASAVIEPLLGLSSAFAVGLGFWFLYVAMPNTKVRLSSALLGALLASVLWIAVQFGYVKLQVGLARYNAIYAGFAALPIFLIWVNVCWVVVLLGAELAAAHQAEPTWREVERPYPKDEAWREVIAARAMTRVATRFAAGRPPASAREISLELGVPVRPVQDALGALAGAGLVASSQRGDEDVYLPARPLERVRVRDVLYALRGRFDPGDAPPRGALDEELDRRLEGLAQDASASPHNRSLAELVAAAEGPQPSEGVRGKASTSSATT